MVGDGFVTLGQRRGQRSTLHWTNADCKRWPNVATDAGPTLDQRIYLGRWPNVGPMSKIMLGKRLSYNVGPTCTYYHGPTLAQHSHAIWVIYVFFFIRPSSDLSYSMVMSRSPSVRPSIRPGLRVHLSFHLSVSCTIFPHALTYWVEILCVRFVQLTSDQVRVSSIYVNFCRSCFHFWS